MPSEPINDYTAADKAVAAADAFSLSLIGRFNSAAEMQTLWLRETEAAAACLVAAKHGPEWVRAQYRETARVMTAFAECSFDQLGA
jgi:hypothetical protein